MNTGPATALRSVFMGPRFRGDDGGNICYCTASALKVK